MTARYSPSVRLHHDERGIILNFVVKTLIVFALLGVVAYDLGQVVVAQVKAQDAAQAAAQAGADTYYMTKDGAKARRAADDAALSEDPSGHVTAFQINKNGTVTVSIQHQANTLIVARVPPLRHFGLQQATDEETHVS
jgi:Flp pilus assembly protein TadG